MKGPSKNPSPTEKSAEYLRNFIWNLFSDNIQQIVPQTTVVKTYFTPREQICLLYGGSVRKKKTTFSLSNRSVPVISSELFGILEDARQSVRESKKVDVYFSYPSNSTEEILLCGDEAEIDYLKKLKDPIFQRDAMLEFNIISHKVPPGFGVLYFHDRGLYRKYFKKQTDAVNFALLTGGYFTGGPPLIIKNK